MLFSGLPVTLYELKARVSLIIWLPDVRRLSDRLSVCQSGCPSVSKPFTFSYSPEPSSEFQPNLAQNVLR